jgi:hypothetical protein
MDAGVTAQSDYYVVWTKSSDNPTGIWYHLTSGPAAGNFVRHDTTDRENSGPPPGMPRR